MPIYEFRCAKGHTFDVFQSIDDDPVTVCEQCGEPVERVFHPIAVHFKGSGFYTTDYGRKGKGSANGGGESKPAEKKAEKGSGSEQKKGDTKPKAAAKD